MRLRQLRVRDDIVLVVVHHECGVAEMAVGTNVTEARAAIDEP
jgi:hypothetical protein